MTRTASTPRPLAAAITAMVAFALLAAPLPVAFATSDTASPMSAQAQGAASGTSTSAVARARAAAITAATAADFGSIFAGQLPSLVDSGWAGCASAITWTVDPGSLTSEEATTEIANLEWAFAQWSLASGLVFAFGGTQSLNYDDAAFSISPADGSTAPARHIFLSFVADAASDRLGASTVGMASPSQVFPTTKEIVAGAAVFRTDHVRAASDREARSLYLHELGHVLGLAHASHDGNIMYPVVTDHLELGAGDVTGVRTMAKPCTETADPDDAI